MTKLVKITHPDWILMFLLDQPASDEVLSKILEVGELWLNDKEKRNWMFHNAYSTGLLGKYADREKFTPFGCTKKNAPLVITEIVQRKITEGWLALFSEIGVTGTVVFSPRGEVSREETWELQLPQWSVSDWQEGIPPRIPPAVRKTKNKAHEGKRYE